jgi:hypothetical protein
MPTISGVTDSLRNAAARSGPESRTFPVMSGTQPDLYYCAGLGVRIQQTAGQEKQPCKLPYAQLLAKQEVHGAVIKDRRGFP